MSRFRHFTFRSVAASRAARHQEIRVVVAGEGSGRAFDWSPTELKSLATISDDDLDDTRAWLSRIGMSEALAAFDS